MSRADRVALKESLVPWFTEVLSEVLDGTRERYDPGRHFADPVVHGAGPEEDVEVLRLITDIPPPPEAK